MIDFVIEHINLAILDRKELDITKPENVCTDGAMFLAWRKHPAEKRSIVGSLHMRIQTVFTD